MAKGTTRILASFLVFLVEFIKLLAALAFIAGIPRVGFVISIVRSFGIVIGLGTGPRSLATSDLKQISVAISIGRGKSLLRLTRI